jgi:putative peptide maturation system protein
MTSTTQRTPSTCELPTAALLADAASTLVMLAGRGGTGDAPARELAQLRARWPDAIIDLVHDWEAADGSIGYDLLIRSHDGTLSVAYSPAPALPWPLRGAVHHGEGTLLRVGPARLDVGEALAALDYLWNSAEVLNRLVDTCVVRAELDRDPIQLDDADRQRAADAFRRAKGLLSAEQTTQWLASAGLSPAAFSELVDRTAAVAALRHRVVDGRVVGWLNEHGAELATLTVAWVAVTESAGSAALPGERAGALAAVTEAIHTGRSAGVLTLSAADAPAALREAAIGQPVRAELAGAPADAVVLDRVPAALNERTRELAERALFDQWLARARADADIEWFWLDAERTAAAG